MLHIKAPRKIKAMKRLMKMRRMIMFMVCLASWR